MNARVSSDEQVQFLLSCIRYSVNGKVSNHSLHYPLAPSFVIRVLKARCF